MSNKSQWLTRMMIAAVVFTFCGGPELMQAQDNSPQASTTQSATPDPSRGPQQPADNQPTAPAAETPGSPTSTPVPVPDAPSTSSSSKAAPAASSQTETQAPAGAAAAERAETAGGAASKPAGNAIAPAKQRQTRSLLIKLGAVAAVGAAGGIIYALSRGTPSLPPGANRTATTAAGR